MASAALRKFYSPEEYLSLDRAAKRKNEYFAGYIRPTASASHEHKLIASNLAAEVRSQLAVRPHRAVYGGDMRVLVRQTGLYAYPDLAVVCGHTLFLDDGKDTLLNPSLIAEVLSPKTESYDRGRKFGQYRQLASLREYVLFAHDEVLVERFLRQGEDWVLTDVRRMEDTLWLASIDCYVPLREIYARIEFVEPSPSFAAP
jgi:Uma2 family endonuclease